MIYLAQPYWHVGEDIRNERAEIAADVTTALINRGFVVFSPIVYGTTIKENIYFEGLENKEWVDLDIKILSKCKLVLILALPGWTKSKGLERELQLTQASNTPHLFIEWDSNKMLDQIDDYFERIEACIKMNNVSSHCCFKTPADAPSCQ